MVCDEYLRKVDGSDRLADRMTIRKAAPDEAGCYVDGGWGQYGIARMILLARNFGYDDSVAIDLARRHIACIGRSDVPELSDDEHAVLSDVSDTAEQWLNDNVAPEGFSFGWYDGEFFLGSDAWWDEGSP